MNVPEEVAGGFLRLSFGPETSEADVDGFLAEFGRIAESTATLPLFEGERGRERLARAIDRLDAKYGKLTVYAASMQDAKDAAPGGIAFSSVPDLALPDSVE